MLYGGDTTQSKTPTSKPPQKNLQEQELKQKNLQERVEMAAEHKTGSVHSLYIRHLEQQQEV